MENDRGTNVKQYSGKNPFLTAGGFYAARPWEMDEATMPKITVGPLPRRPSL